MTLSQSVCKTKKFDLVHQTVSPCQIWGWDNRLPCISCFSLLFCMHCYILYNILFLSVGLKLFYLAPLFDLTPRTLTPLECPFCSRMMSRDGSHIFLWMPLQQEPQASGEIHSSISTKMCTLKNCSNNRNQSRWMQMKALLPISSSIN